MALFHINNFPCKSSKSTPILPDGGGDSNPFIVGKYLVILSSLLSSSHLCLSNTFFELSWQFAPVQRTYCWFMVVGFFQMLWTCNFLPEPYWVSHPPLLSMSLCTARHSRHSQSPEVLTWWDGHAMLLWWFCSWPSSHWLIFPSWNFSTITLLKVN